MSGKHRVPAAALAALVLAACATPAQPRARLEPLPGSASTPLVADPDDLHAGDDALTRRVVGELSVFAGWLQQHDVKGFVGEVGWPDDTSGDAENWNQLAERWYQVADEAELWVSAWATGERWGQYPLAAYEIPPDGRGTSVDRADTQSAVLEAHLGSDDRRRGIAVAGGSFGDTAPGFSELEPGVPGIDYGYAGPATMAYLAARGYDFVRVDFRWERLQPALFAALEGGELERLRATVEAAGDAGLQVVLDLHNYGEYRRGSPSGPVRATVGSDDLPVAALVDLWERLSDEFSGDPTVLAYGIMNEPHDLAVRQGTPRPWHGWDADLEGWEGPVAHETTAQRSGPGALRISWTGETDSEFLANSDDARKDCSTGGSTFSAWLYLPEDSPEGLWTASLQIQKATYDYVGGPHEPLRPGTWTQVRHTPPPSLLGSCRALALHLTGPRDTPVDIVVDDLEQEGRLLPAQVWEAASQAVVSALREREDHTLLMVPGHRWSAVHTWQQQHPKAWITDPADAFRYEAHHYWDQQRSSDYRSYAEELADSGS